MDDIRPQPWLNRWLLWLLHSPVSGSVDATLVGLRLRGRKTERVISLPVQYAVGSDCLWLWPGDAANKTWWRNLVGGADVQLQLRGQPVDGVAQALTRSTHPEEVAEGLTAYAARFPLAGLRARQGSDREGQTVQAPADLVRVRIPSAPFEAARAATLVEGGRLIAFARRHPLSAFFALALLFSWGYWLPAVIAGGTASHFPGLLGPLLAAVAMSAVIDGHRGVRALLARTVRWRVSPRWYAAALFPAIAGGVAIAAEVALGRTAPTSEDLSFVPGLPRAGWWGALLLVVVINAYGEETGWRGFAWSRLRDRHTLGGAALLLSIPWAAWHIPTLWLDTGMRGFPLLLIPGWRLGLAAGSVVLGWLYERTGSSLLIVVLFHALLNMASAPPATEGVARVFVSMGVVVWALVLLRADGRRRASARSATQLSSGAEAR